MTQEQRTELWRWAVHNRAFDLLQRLTEMRSTFEALSTPNCFAFDKWSIAERQMRVCELELENLRRAVCHLECPELQASAPRAD